MGMMEALTLAPVTLLWVFVVIRVRGVLYGGSQRLAGILLALAIAVTLRLSFVGQIIDDITGVNGLETLVRHSAVILMATYAAWALVDVIGGRPVRPWVTRIGAITVTAALISMAFLWHALGPDRRGLKPMGPETGADIPFAYLTLYILSYGIPIGVCVAIAVRDARRPGPRTPGRRGLALFGIGAAFTIVYLTTKAVALVAARVGAYDHPFLVHAETIQAVPSAIAILFIVLGAASWTQLHLRERWLHRRLSEPWAALTTHVPAVVLRPPLRNPQARLNRRVHEIREAATLLLTHVTPADVEAAQRVPEGVAPAAVLLELARLRAAALPLDAAPGTAIERVDLPTDPAALERFFRSRRRAQRAARDLATPHALKVAR